MSSLLLTNGRIYTGNAAQPWAEGILIQNGRVAWVGQGRAPMVDCPSIDLGGRLVLPGLVDGHIHFLAYASGLESVRMVGVESLAQALSMVADKVAELSPGEWVVGDSYNHNVWGMDREPNRYDLDRVSPDHPVVIASKCGHTAWVNSKALELAGITAATVDPVGSRIDRDERGEPTGLLREGAQGLIYRVIPEPDGATTRRLLKKAIANAHAAGLTGIHDCEGSDALQLFSRLAQDGELDLRVTMHIPQSELEHAIKLGLISGFGGEWVRIGGIKAFTDGALGTQTALMFEPCEGSNNTGIQTMTEDELRTVVVKGAEHGLSAAVHAIGDRANALMLDIYEDLLKCGSRSLRHRIEHAQLVRPEDISRCGSLGIIASVQPIHVLGDMEIVDRYWGRRGRYAYAFKSLAAAGSVLAFGSDAPVESFDPMLGVHAAVNRRRPDGLPDACFYTEECLSVVEAVRAYTWGPAFAAYQEQMAGTLEVGKLGDLVVLDRDIFTIDPTEIHATQVEMTVVGGKVVYQR